jgi:hypothetical protein
MTAPKLPTILAATALAVSVFGATPLGQAASSVILPKNSGLRREGAPPVRCVRRSADLPAVNRRSGYACGISA